MDVQPVHHDEFQKRPIRFDFGESVTAPIAEAIVLSGRSQRRRLALRSPALPRQRAQHEARFALGTRSSRRGDEPAFDAGLFAQSPAFDRLVVSLRSSQSRLLATEAEGFEQLADVVEVVAHAEEVADRLRHASRPPPVVLETDSPWDWLPPRLSRRSGPSISAAAIATPEEHPDW